MEKFKQFLENENFDGAINFLKSSDDIALPIKYYNLGYVYVQKNEFVTARYYFEKARAEGFINQKVNASLKLVKENLGVEQVESSYSYLDKTLLETANFRDEVFFSFLGIVLLVGIIAVLKTKKIMTIISVILFFSLGALLFVFKDHRVALLKEEVYVYQGPSRIFEPNQLISPGTKVMIEEEKEDWKFIGYPKIYRGWIYKAKVRKL